MEASLGQLHDTLDESRSAIVLAVDEEGKLGFASFNAGVGHIVSFTALLNRWVVAVMTPMLDHITDSHTAGELLASESLQLDAKLADLNVYFQNNPAGTSHENLVEHLEGLASSSAAIKGLLSPYRNKEKKDAEKSTEGPDGPPDNRPPNGDGARDHHGS